MDAELSLVTANQALAAPGKLVYDPFAGTGSFLCTASAFGATSMGSDIDGRQIKGKDGISIASNFKQYGLSHLLLDTLVFDIVHPPLHPSLKFDAIIADPPYGVRAGAKTLGRKEGSRLFGRKQPGIMPDGRPVHLRDNYIPPKKPYELSDLADDLLDFAAARLVVGGRLVFWLPTVSEDYQPVDIPARTDMELLANSVQDFGKWSRRLLTYRRSFLEEDGLGERVAREREGGGVVGHKDFRERYYMRFGSRSTEFDEAAIAKLSPKEREYR